MSFARGTFGIEYQPRRTHERTNHLLWFVVVVVVLSLIAFGWYKFHQPGDTDPNPNHDVPQKPANAEHQPDRHPKSVTGTTMPSPPAARAARSKPAAVTLPPPRPTPTVAPKVRPLVKKIHATIEQRSASDRPLLQKYIDAEAQERSDIVVEALKLLVRSPSLADLHNDFYHRWGDLNLNRLISGKNSVWTTVITARKGDGKERIAREHRTTVAVVERLNPTIDWERFRPGTPVRVLAFPSVTLVVNRDGTADLTLRKGEAFFRRYDITLPQSTRAGVYEIVPAEGATVYKRIRELGLVVSKDTRRELEMFLAPKSRIVVK